MKRLGFSLAIAGLFARVLALPAAAPADSGTNDRILQQELKQQQIKTTTQRVADQLASIISEFDRNQIAGEDVKVLKAVRSVLGSLTEKDMQLVIGYLQEAREAADPAAGNRRATEAFSRQKGIILQLKQLLAEYQREHKLYLLSLRFKELARKESEIMRLGVRLAKTTEGKAATSFGELEQNSLKLQQIEQDALKAEIGLAVGELEKLSKEITDGPTAGRPKAAVEQIKEGGLMSAVDTALTELSKGLILSATGNEKKARDQLREVARLLILSEDKIEALRQALHELEQTIDQQHSVVTDTRKVDTRDAANEAEDKQAEVVDNTDLIRRDVDSLAPIAAEHLGNATDKMQEARGALTASEDPRKRREKALPKQDDALTDMEQARRALQEQLAKAEESTQPQNTLASLKELQQQVQELIERERAHKDDAAAAKATDLAAKAPRQGELKDTAQDLQQKASSPAPDAARSIGEAANQMQKAQNSLAAARNNPAAQQAAIDALEKAEQQLGQQIAKLEQAEKNLAQLDELLKRLEGIIDDQQKLQFGTAKEAAAPETKPLTDLASRQEKLSQDTGQLQQEAATPAPAAAPHLGQAKERMGQAKQELDKPAAQTAQPKQTEALSDLYAAKKEMEKQRDALRDMLGMPPDDNSNLADAQSLIEQAQEDVNQAMQQMQQGLENSSESLRQQQQKIADSLSANSQNAPAQSPVNKAQQAAQQAAQQLAQSDLPNAVKSMQAAQSAMQQAMQGNKPGQPGKSEQDEAAASLPQLSQQQSDVQKAAESLMAALQAAPASALKQAAQRLEHAGNTIGPLTSGQLGAMPSGAQSALEAAEQALASGAAQASSGQGAPAQASATAAAQALAQAQAALSLAQAGLGSQPGNQPGNQPGQGQGQGQGQGRNPARTPGTPGPQGDGQGNWAGAGGAEGARRGTAGSSTFVGLPKRDRAALQQSQSEKYPQEYGPLVEQYLKNLSDQAGEK